MLNTRFFGFVADLEVAGFGFGFFFPAPGRNSSASRSFFEASLVRPVVSTVRAVGAGGTAEGDFGALGVSASP